MNAVDINAEAVPLPSLADRARDFSLKVLEELGLDNWNLSILFCNNAFIRKLNAQYRHVDAPTDVLSFASGGEPVTFGEGAPIPYLPGDIVISLDALRENEGFFNVSEDEELRRLIIHGILHLNGMDHETNRAEEPMLIKQEELLKKVKL
jgi:probable rRNA maturation factor